MADKPHTMTEDCWCGPKVLKTPGAVTIQHRREVRKTG